MLLTQMNNSFRIKILGTLIVSLLVCSPADAQQSRVATPSRTNAKAPAVKAPAAVSTTKTAAVTTSKTIAPVVAPRPVVAPVVAPKPVVATVATTAVIAPAKPADSKTVVGETQAGKTSTTAVATIARPTATSTAVDAIAVSTTGPTSSTTATVAPLPLSSNQIAKAVAALADGTITAANFTALLAGGGTEPVVAAVDPAREIWATTWEEQPSLQYVFPMVWLRWPMDKQPIYENNIERYQSFFPRVSVPDVASIKGALSALPPGRRALFAWHFGAGFFGDTTWSAENVPNLDGTPSPQPSPWCQSAVELARTQWTAALSSMKAQDVNFDFLVLDNEHRGSQFGDHIVPSEIVSSSAWSSDSIRIDTGQLIVQRWQSEQCFIRPRVIDN